MQIYATWTEEELVARGPRAVKNVLANALRSGRIETVELCESVLAKYAPPAGGGEKMFWRLVDRSEEASCWQWRGRRNTNHNTAPHVKRYEYGTWDMTDGRHAAAHRAAIFYLFGTHVPDDLDLTSLCGDELCINPFHRGVVSKQDRIDRKTRATPASVYFAKGTLCQK